MMATATAPMLTMLGVMGCASLCALFASCRPVASMVCALAMILGMIDVAYTHLLPIELIVAAIVASGLWVGLSGTMTADPRDRSEEHTSELQSLMRISYAVFCLKNKNTN